MNKFVKKEYMSNQLTYIIQQSLNNICIDDCEMTVTAYNYNPFLHTGLYSITMCKIIVDTYGMAFNPDATAFLDFHGVLIRK